MVNVDIKNVQQMLQKKITFGHTKCLSKKKLVLLVMHRYSIIMCFSYTYILEKYNIIIYNTI